MVGENVFPDTAAMISARNAAAQAVARQQTSILNVEAARNEALKRVAQGRFVTVPTSVNQSTIGRSNQIGYSAPTVTSMRGLTPNGPVQRAMSPSLQTNNVFEQGILSGNGNQGAYSQPNAAVIAQSQAAQAAANANKALGISTARSLGTSSSGKKIIL
jgi:hypothetical protein